MWDSSWVFSDRMATRLSTSIGDRGLRLAGKFNVPLYRLSRGRLFGNFGGCPVVLLTTTGRKSGEQRTAPVIFMREGEGLVVIGSNAGNARPPAWSLNLKADPQAEVQVKGDRWPVVARVTEGEERSDLWKRFTADYSGFDDYDARTARDIAVFVLEPSDA